MKNYLLASLICLLILSTFPPVFGQSETDSISIFLEGEPTVLLGITGVDDLDSDSTETKAWNGGGLELVRAFSTKHYPNLKPCAFEVRNAVLDWKNTLNLVPAYDKLETTTITFMLWQPDRQGLFEVKYMCKDDGSYARSWLNYYTLSGERIEVEAVSELYQTYKISDLWDALSKSMGCFAE